MLKVTNTARDEARRFLLRVKLVAARIHPRRESRCSVSSVELSSEARSDLCRSEVARKAEPVRNVFDQYHQLENKLTHALSCTLEKDRSLIVPFLKWLGIADLPPAKDIRVVEQQIPGTPIRDNECDVDGLPDLCLYTDDGWAVLFEMKVQATLTGKQLQRHAGTAQRAGFSSPKLVAVTVEVSKASLPPGTVVTQWRELYAWFAHQDSDWARIFVNYLEAFEANALATDYDIRGTITMFNGLRFDSENPYTYREAKRLIRLLGDEMQASDELERELGVDPKANRRKAITEDRFVWDFLPLKAASGAGFTSFPHLTMVIEDTHAEAALTVPNGVSGGFRTKLNAMGFDGFLALMREIEARIRPVMNQSKGAKTLLYATQRHYRSQRSIPSVDGRIDIDLRTCLESGADDVKYQPQWAEAVYHLLVNKQSNIQFGIEARFDYACEKVRSPAAVDLFAASWKAMKPLLEFVLSTD